MTYYKVEMHQCFDTCSSVVATWYFKSESEANNFIEKGNAILEKSRAYDYHIYDEGQMEINNDNVEVELKKLEKEFENYKY